MDRVQYYIPQELEDILYYSANSIRTILCRPEFVKFKEKRVHKTRKGYNRLTEMYRVDEKFMNLWNAFMKMRNKKWTAKT